MYRIKLFICPSQYYARLQIKGLNKNIFEFNLLKIKNISKIVAFYGHKYQSKSSLIYNTVDCSWKMNSFLTYYLESWNSYFLLDTTWLYPLVVIRVDKKGSPTGYRIIGEEIVYDEVRDKTAKELVSNPNSGYESDIPENCE